jgi:SAM-dependent methyltransferase
MIMESVENSVSEWNREIQREKKEEKYPKWPNEVMLKVLFGGGDYLRDPCKPQKDWKVLDVGCGFANNLVPFADLGCECHGVDLHPEMAATVQGIMDRRGYKTKIQAGSNRSLPYPDACFDLILSVNTLHYEGTEGNIDKALREFRRVIKPGGALYLSTVGPAHTIFTRAEKLGPHRYKVKNFDFRDGQDFFFFEDEDSIQEICKRIFPRVETGRVTEKLMNLPLDFLIALCR